MSDQPRTPPGSPEGGRFSASVGAESSNALSAGDTSVANIPPLHVTGGDIWWVATEADAADPTGQTPMPVQVLFAQTDADTAPRIVHAIAAAQRLEELGPIAGQVLRSVEELESLPELSLVRGGDEVYESRINRQGAKVFRCLHEATDYMEWAEYDAKTVLWQEYDGPRATVLFTPPETV